MSNIRSTRTNSRGGGTLAKLALLLVSLLAIFTISEGIRLEQTDPLILLETPFQVETRTNLVNMEILFSNPCLVSQIDLWDSVYDLKKKSYNKIPLLSVSVHLRVPQTPISVQVQTGVRSILLASIDVKR